MVPKNSPSIPGLALVLAGCGSGSSADGAPAESTSSASTSDSADASTSSTWADASSESSTSDESSDSSSGGELECALPRGSPPSLIYGGQTLVPIDTLAVEAKLRFDTDAQAASGTATLSFALGPEGGMPIFDLRQTITAIELDGATLGADRAPFFRPSDDPDGRMRALTEVLAPCSEHTLVLEYELDDPDAQGAAPPVYESSGVVWSSGHSDLDAGRYAEQWWPMNLVHDAVDIAVEIEVVGSDFEHVLASNGEVVQVADYQWRVEFPSEFTAMSPLLVLQPELLTLRGSAQVDLPEGGEVTVDAVVRLGHIETVDELLVAAGEGIIAADLELGDYPHGERFLVYGGGDGVSSGMEYAGATASWAFYLPHEVFHSWIGRGLAPLTARDGWLDEAWATYALAGLEPELLPADAPPVTLAPADPWTRVTPSPDAYDTGSRVLATIAADIGVDELRGLLREFYLLHPGRQVTTEDLELFLVCATEGETVHDTFARFVYGDAPALAPVDRADCP